MESETANVKVAVRVRPQNKREIELASKSVITLNGDTQVVIKNPLIEQQVRSFTFDHCFASTCASNDDQLAVYEAVGRDALDQAFKGYNACIFAYGQTGSGKSYTIHGNAQQPGIVPRLCNELFERIEAHRDKKVTQKVEVSYLEIYNESVYDLLNPENGRRGLRVREHNVTGPFVEGLSQLAVNSHAEVASVLVEGNKSRTIASTNMNAESSRSHSVFTIVLTQTLTDSDCGEEVSGEKVSKIRLVDLAGSERASKSGATGERLKEGGNINKSLTTLGLVISVLADVSSGRRPAGTHVPYRDSSLTWLLKDSIGGNSKTAMMATVSPAADNFDESLSTLRYADRAKRIENRAVVNEDANARTIRVLRDEIAQLRNQLAIAARSAPAIAPTITSNGNGNGSGEQVADARERLELNEALVKELSRTWDDRVRETERTNKVRAEALDRIGVSVADSGISVDRNKFYLVNLDADPTYNGLLVYYLRDRMLIGSRHDLNDAENSPPDIQLDGVGIEKRHCLVLIGGFDESTPTREKVAIEPIDNAMVKVNGKRIKRRVILKHGDRLLLGMSCSFRLQCPRDDIDADLSRSVVTGIESGSESDSSSDEMLNDVTEYQPGVFVDSVRDALNRHATASYANLFDAATAPNSAARRNDRGNWLAETISTRERAFQRSLRALRERIRKANRLARHANFIARRMRVPVTYSVTLQIPAERLRVEDGSFTSGAGILCEPAIIVRARRLANAAWNMPSTLVRNDQTWSIEKLEFRLNEMCELNRLRELEVPHLQPQPVTDVSIEQVHIEFNEAFDASACRTATQTDSEPFRRFEELAAKREIGEPFCDSNEQHTLIGVANVHLLPLFYDAEFEYDAPIVNQQGEISGKLRVRIARLFRFSPASASTTPTVAASAAARKIDDDCIELTDRNEDWQAEDGGETHADFAPPSNDDDASSDDHGETETDACCARLTLGARIGVRITLLEARDLPAALAHFVFAQYRFYSQVDPVVVAQRQDLKSQSRTTIRFDHTQNFQMRVTGELKEYFESAALAIEVFGNRIRDSARDRMRLADMDVDFDYPSSQNTNTNANSKSGLLRGTSRESAQELHESVASRMKSIEERWMETSRKVQLWVDVLELNEQGEYAPVPIDSFASLQRAAQTAGSGAGAGAVPPSGTGGIYVLRHGHSRRLVVRIAPLSEQTAPTGLSCGSLPLLLDSIVSAQLGCVVSRDASVQKPLDSYQDVDLARVRSAWLRRNDARKANIDARLRELDAQKEASTADNSSGPASPSNYTEREKELIEQLMMLAEERNTIQCPLANSHVPGAELIWQPSVGLEEHIPLIFLQRTDEDGEVDSRLSTSQTDYAGDYHNGSIMDLSRSSTASASNGRYRTIAGATCSLPKEHRPQMSMSSAIEMIDRDFVILPIVQTDLLESHNTLFATVQWDAALHESVSLNRISRSSEVLFLVLRVVVRLRQPEVCCVLLRKRIAVRVISATTNRESSAVDSVRDSSPSAAKIGANGAKRGSSGFGSRLVGFFRRNEPTTTGSSTTAVASPSSALDNAKPTSTGVIYELVWRIPSILDDVEMNRDTLAKLAAESLDDDLDHAGEESEDDAEGDADAEARSASSDSENEVKRAKNGGGDTERDRKKPATRYRRLLDSYMKSISAIESLWIVEKLRQELALKEQMSAKAPPVSSSDARKAVLSKTSSTPNLFRSASLASLQYAPSRPVIHHVATDQSLLSHSARSTKPTRTESVIDLSGGKRRGRLSAGEQRSSLTNQFNPNSNGVFGRNNTRQISVVEEEQNAAIITPRTPTEISDLLDPVTSAQRSLKHEELRTDFISNTASEIEAADGRDGLAITSVTSSGYDSHTSTLSVSACAESLRNGGISTSVDAEEQLASSLRKQQIDSGNDLSATEEPVAGDEPQVEEQESELRTIDEDESAASTHGSSDGVEAIAEWMTLGQRCRVAVRHGELPLRGTIRFVGKTHFANQKDADAVWVGVELESAAGKNGGTVDGVSYFRCRHKHGLFVRPSRLMPLRSDANPSRTDVTRKRLDNPSLAGSRYGSNPNLAATRKTNVEKTGVTVSEAGAKARSSLDAAKRKPNRE